MRRLFILIAVFAGLGCAILLAYAPSAPSMRTKQLLVGTNAEYPPYTFVEQRELVGFDIDVAREVCRRLGLEMALRDLPFESLVPELQTGHLDLVAAGLTPTEERAKRVLFSKVYYSGDPLVLASRVPLSPGADWRGARIAVNDGYTADLQLSQEPELELVRFSAPIDALLALEGGQVYLFAAAESTVREYQARQGDKQLYLLPLSEFSDAVALAVAPGQPALVGRVNEVLEEMEADGTMEILKRRWGL